MCRSLTGLNPLKGLLKGAVEYAGPTACFELFQRRGPHQSRWKGLCASPSEATIFYSGNSTEIHANYRVRSPSCRESRNGGNAPDIVLEMRSKRNKPLES